MGHAEVGGLLGGWGVGACEPGEVAAGGGDPAAGFQGAEEAGRLRAAAGWLGAAEALTPPSTLRSAVFARARAMRMPERNAEPTLATPGELVSGQVARIEALLDDVEPEQWRLPTVNGWDAQGTVAHLLAGASLINRPLGLTDAAPAEGETDWDARPAGVVERHHPLPATETVTGWRDHARRLASYLDAAGDDELDGTIEWFGLQTPVSDVAT